jgi:hypothetical protein
VASRRAILPDLAGIWGIVIFLTLTAVAGSKALKDGDTLWHIKMGQVMLERGEVLKHDLFSHTVYGQPWHAHEWLSEIIMAGLHGWAGLPGVTIFFFALVGLTFTLLFKVANRIAGEMPSTAAMAFALICIYFHLLARPHIFTWLGAALTLYLLERGGRWPWLLLPLTLVWTNLHAGVLFGLVLQATFVAGRLFDQLQATGTPGLRAWWQTSKEAVLLLGLCITATCMNPFGYQIFVYPFIVADPVFTRAIGEWQSPDFQQEWFARIWLVALMFLAVWIGRKLSWRWLLLILFLLWQTLGHVRHLSMAALLLIPCFAIFFEDLGRRLNIRRETPQGKRELALSPWSGPIAIIILAQVFIGAAGTAPHGTRNIISEFYPPAKDYAPVMAYLRQGYPEGNLLNEYEWGDYLLYGLEHPPLVFIDGRADMFGPEIFSDYLKIVGLEEGNEELLDKYRIEWVLFPKDHLLIRYLRDCMGWQSLYTDQEVEILTRPGT